jgi:pyruvate dehydrogenase E2 component (dihydrolipoyllysine-residue acetyltransferase)
MSTEILMPAPSPNVAAATLARWHVKPGDHVDVGQVIAELETDKATIDLEAERDGEIAEILVEAGTEQVPVDTVIARMASARETPSTPKEPAVIPEADADTVPPRAASPKKEAMLSLATQSILRKYALDPTARPDGGQAGQIAKGDALTAADHLAPSGTSARIFASPLAKVVARQLAVDLSDVSGSGPRGRILKKDVEAAAVQAERVPEPVADTRQVPSLEQMGIAPGSYDLIPLDGMRKTVARRMTESFRDVPHFPLSLDIEIDALLAARARINGLLEQQGVRVSVNDFVLKAAAVALKRVPEANASYTPEGIAMHHHADIAVAVAIPGGLITPIIRAAETKGLAQIATEAKDLAERARSKKLKPEEFQGGTFSVSNLGMFGIKTFASIINEPQGAILSVGAGEKRPVVKGDQLVVATVMSVTLTCDHRVVDGATGARWLAAFRELLEEPLRMIV